jgi:hypothetical protein
VAGIVRAVSGPRVGEGVQGHADGAVTDGVHVDLESIAIQCDGEILERCGIVDRCAGVTVPVEIRC